MVYGVGINDLSYRHEKPKNEQEELENRIYILWRAMIERCYSEYRLNVKPTYKKCKVCDKWLKLSGFVDDLPKIKGYELWKNNKGKYSLDKDLLQKDEEFKIYSLETCQFITIKENSSERMERNNPNPPQKVMVINIKTGETYEFKSIRKTAKFVGGTKTAVKNHCINGKEYKGFIFKLVGDNDE